MCYRLLLDHGRQNLPGELGQLAIEAAGLGELVLQQGWVAVEQQQALRVWQLGMETDSEGALQGQIGAGRATEKEVGPGRCLSQFPESSLQIPVDPGGGRSGDMGETALGSQQIVHSQQVEAVLGEEMLVERGQILSNPVEEASAVVVDDGGDRRIVCWIESGIQCNAGVGDRDVFHKFSLIAGSINVA